MATTNVDDELDIDTLRRLIRNCRHGGPPEAEQATVYFLNVRTSVDRLNESSSTQDMRDAVRETLRLIRSDPVLDQMRSTPASARFCGALAVDAWSNNDVPHMKSFLIKGLFLEFLLVQGPAALQSEQLIARLKQILLGEDIKSLLQSLTHRACECVEMADIINKVLAEQDPSARATQQQREIEELPPILRPDSTLWILTTKATKRLQNGSLEKAIELYTQAAQLIDKDIKKNIKSNACRRGWVQLQSEEAGRIQSNLSLAYAKLRLYDKALYHADKAAANFPSWSKPHCRRALALEGLGRFDAADAAVAKALEAEQAIFAEDDKHAKTIRKNLDEYRKIQQRLEAAHEAQPAVVDIEKSVRALRIDVDNVQAGSFVSIWGATHILDEICKLLLPVDVARLERTCRAFAAEPERKRRFSLSSPLWNLALDEVDDCALIFCREKLDDPNGALRDLLTSILTLNFPSFSFGAALPSWMRAMLNHPNFVLRKQICAVCIRSHESLREPLCHWVFQNLRDLLYDNLLDEDETITQCFRTDRDGDLLRLISWVSPLVESDVDADDKLQEMQQMAFVTMNNLLAKGYEIQRILSQESELSKLATDLVGIFTRHIPKTWPNKEALGQDWECTAEQADVYFSNSHPRVFRRWKSALSEVLLWAQEAEPLGFQYILLNQVTMLENLSHYGTIPANVFSMGTFVMKKCIETGGAKALRNCLRGKRDYCEFFAEYSDMLCLYNDTFPRLSAWKEGVLVERNATS